MPHWCETNLYWFAETLKGAHEEKVSLLEQEIRKSLCPEKTAVIYIDKIIPKYRLFLNEIFGICKDTEAIYMACRNVLGK